jgi:hypothetical protein
MLTIYLRLLGVFILLLGIFNALWYALGVEIALGIMCGMLLFDVYIGELVTKLKGGK